jgi:hypothetical protein
MSDLEAQFLPARDVLGIAQRIVGARIAEAEDRDDEAVALLEEAAALEATIPYMEPSYWYAPVHRTLGAVLLGQAARARHGTRSKSRWTKRPRDAWAQWGLWRAWVLIDGEGPRVDQARASFLDTWLGEKTPDPRAALTKGRAYWRPAAEHACPRREFW